MAVTSALPNDPVLHYLVKEPTGKTTSRKAIILLHGVGSNEQDLFGLANYLPDDFYIISARGPYTLGAGRFAWYNVDFSTGKPVIQADQELSSRAVIKTFVEQIKAKYELDEVYLGGFSQGAIMSFSVGLTNPAAVKGIIAFSGRLLEQVRPAIVKSDALAKVKVFLAHGTHDGTLPVQYARDARTFLQTLNVPLTYHEYAMGHQISQETLTDVKAWLLDVR